MKGVGTIVLSCRICEARFRVHPSRSIAMYCGLECSTVARRRGLLKARPKTRHGSLVLRPWTEAERQLVRDRYSVDGPRVLAEKLGRKATNVQSMGERLGVTRSTKGRWTVKEDEFLRDNISKMPWAKLASALGRTIGAVQIRSKHIRLSRYDGSDTWTATEVAAIFGVDRGTPENWVQRGWLDGRRVDYIGGAGTWRITPQAVHDFIHKHPTRFNIAKVDQIAFIDICRGEGLKQARQVSA